MKLCNLKSKFMAIVVMAVLLVSLPTAPVIYADSEDLPFEAKEGFKIENIAAGKNTAATSGWLTDVSEFANGDIFAYEYINKSTNVINTGNLLIDGDMTTYAEFESLFALEITHNFSGIIGGVEIFYAPKSESIGETIHITDDKLNTLETFTIQGEQDKLTSVFVPLNYETDGNNLNIYSGGLWGYALNIYEIKIYSPAGGKLEFDKITDEITDAQNSFKSLNADGKAIIDLGEEYELAGIRLFSAENMKLYLCSEYPDGDLDESDLAYTSGSSSSGSELVSCNRSARYLCLAATDISVKCAEIEAYAYIPAGGAITPEELINLNASYPSADGFEGVTNIAGQENIVIAFNEPIIPSTLNINSVALFDNGGAEVTYIGLTASENSVLIPIANLKSNGEYRLRIKKGIVTKTGKSMSDDFNISFKTGKLRETIELADAIISITPAEGATGVTNLNAYGFVKVGFSVDMDASSFGDGVDVRSIGGKSVDNIEYIFENNEYKLDLSCLESDTKYMLTFKADKLKATDNYIIGDDFSFTFTTGYIFPYKSIEGYIITNVALNKEVYSNSREQEDLYCVNNGNYDDHFISYASGGGMNVIDLGNYYKIIAVQYVASKHFNYNETSDNHYHTKDTSIYSSCEYPNSAFSNANLLHITKAHLRGEKTLIKNTGSEYARYITTKSIYAISVYAELEVYAYVKEDYMPITYNITQNECVVSTSVKNYTGSDKDIYMLITAYDDKGDFVGLKCKKFVAAANSTTPLTVRYGLSEVTNSLSSASAKKIVIQLVGGFRECKVLSSPVEITR